VTTKALYVAVACGGSIPQPLCSGEHRHGARCFDLIEPKDVAAVGSEFVMRWWRSLVEERILEIDIGINIFYHCIGKDFHLENHMET